MSGSTWENVYSTSGDVLERRQVTGGWLYRNRYATSGSAQDPQHWIWNFAITFVPEPAP